MSDGAWHADPALLARYRAGGTDLPATASVEAHLIGCPDCRARLAGLAADPVLERAWTGVVAGIGTPRPSPVTRILRRVRVPDADLVVLRAARAFDGPWVIAVLAVVVFAALSALAVATSGRALYLLVAPLVPVAGVTVAFAAADPIAELAAATPLSTSRVALLRTAAVCATGAPAVVAVGALVPPIGWLAVAWLAPALALTLLTLVLMTWWSPVVAGAASAAAWTTCVVAARTGAGDATDAAGPGVLVAYLLAAAALAGLLALRLRHDHAPGGTR